MWSQRGEHTEPLTDDGQEALGLWKGWVGHLAAATSSKLGSWILGFSQDIKVSSLTLQVLFLKASRYPDKVSDSATLTFRPWWPFNTAGRSQCTDADHKEKAVQAWCEGQQSWALAQLGQTPSSLDVGEGQPVT